MIEHKFVNELTELEERQVFCGRRILKKSKILIIGTFNPANKSCVKENQATWFYGRKENWFWKYLPECLTGNSLHNLPDSEWKRFCANNGIVIVDLLKRIGCDSPLEDFKDKRLDERINDTFSNIEIFDFKRAFRGINFEKVIYTRKGWNSSPIKKFAD